MILLTRRWRGRARFDNDSRRITAINTFTLNTERNYDHE